MTSTIATISSLFKDANIEWILTRFVVRDEQMADDLDVLIHSRDFEKAKDAFRRNGFSLLSHDAALGGRLAGYQINVVKRGFVKIDLHKDFTWRRTKYFSDSFFWEGKIEKDINHTKVFVPGDAENAFLVSTNVIFEKTYFSKHEYEFVMKNHELMCSDRIVDQARRHGWAKTYVGFCKWIGPKKSPSFPLFLPWGLVAVSFWEKTIHDRQIDIVNLMYTLFFRVRYTLTKQLPYE
jgi:hypothetical protein